MNIPRFAVNNLGFLYVIITQRLSDVKCSTVMFLQLGGPDAGHAVFRWHQVVLVFSGYFGSHAYHVWQLCSLLVTQVGAELHRGIGHALEVRHR